MQDEVQDGSYMFLYHVTISYLLAFHLYTEATRKNHIRRMMAARVVLLLCSLLVTTQSTKFCTCEILVIEYNILQHSKLTWNERKVSHCLMSRIGDEALI